MATLDIIIILCLIPFAVQGIRKGFIAQVVSLLNLVVGVWVGFHFSDLACSWLAPYLGNVSPTLLKVIGFILLFFLTSIVLTLIGKSLEGLFKFVLLNWMNRLFGFMLAMVKGIIITGTVIVLFHALNGAFELVSEETLKESTLYWPLKDIALQIFPFFKALIFKS